jgi:ABC-type Fe3+-hydroxamate transport system substrate-binding protein
MRQIRAVAALAAIVALAGCGSEDAEPSSGGGQPGFPVTIEHKFGTTEIAAAPERVVTVGFTEQDMVLALGVEPVGIREFLGGYAFRERPWAQGLIDGPPPAAVGGQEIDFERVAAQRPDLIIGVNSGMSKADYDKLSRIAPTVAQSDEFIDFGVPWQDQTLTIGRALGREQRARKVVDDVEAQFAQAREDHPEFAGAGLVMAYGTRGDFGAHSSQDYRLGFFEDLGFRSPPRVDELAGDGFFVDFDEEHFRLMDQDVVVLFGKRDDVTSDPVFARLDAVASERVVYVDLVDRFAGALGFSSPLSLPYLLDEAVPKLAAAIDGDPKTTAPEPE